MQAVNIKDNGKAPCSTGKAITPNAPRMGRPPIGKFTAVRLPPEMLARIDAQAGPGKRAAFIREAVEKELKRRERIAQNPPP